MAINVLPHSFSQKDACVYFSMVLEVLDKPQSDRQFLFPYYVIKNKTSHKWLKSQLPTGYP